MAFSGKVGFAIGSGRCGTLFLHQLMQMQHGVASSHERNPDNEAFHRYCKWHGLPIDNEGFLACKEQEIQGDLSGHRYSFEASPYLSLSVRELHERFGAKFIFLIRRPDGVVSSFAQKGFYREPYRVGDPALAAGYQAHAARKFFMYFARVSPRGQYVPLWNQMTQIGRVAWFWKAFNERALEALGTLPPETYRVVRIEDFDHDKYVDVCGFLGIAPSVDKPEFKSLRASKPHADRGKRTVDQWSQKEIEEFESQVEELATRFDYPFRISQLADQVRAEKSESARVGLIPKSKPPKRFWRARRAAAHWLRGLAQSVDT